MIPAAGGAIAGSDEGVRREPGPRRLAEGRHLLRASQRTWAYLYRLDPATLKLTKLAPGTDWIMSGVTFTADGSHGGLRRRQARSSSRRCSRRVARPSRPRRAKKLTDMGAQIASWPQPTHEVVTWKSTDGTPIEGVLHKPANFQPGKRYPLLVVIHGGPTGTSRPVPFNSTTTYPIDIWLNKGALVLEPNYRGSAGYGEKFRSLNVRNLGDRRRVGRHLGHRLPGRAGPRRQRQGRHDGLEPGRLHLGVPHNARQRAVQGGLGGRGHFELDDVLREHRHPPVHAPVSEGDAVGRSEDLRRHVADDLHQAGEGADAYPARRARQTRAHPERLRALPGPAGPGRAGEAHRLQGLRPRADQAEGAPRRDGAQPRVVREVHLGRDGAGAQPPAAAPAAAGPAKATPFRGHDQLREDRRRRSPAPAPSSPRRRRT